VLIFLAIVVPAFLAIGLFALLRSLFRKKAPAFDPLAFCRAKLGHKLPGTMPEGWW